MTLLAVTLLWWFLRFDIFSGRTVMDGGVTEQMQCEALAAEHGYLVRLLSSRPVPGGRMQRACFQAPTEVGRWTHSR